uniref:Uncharacterized protein n=1 Tax=viral metagenome TaxID=1070528 RepID=A0A6M3II79_9ZZZZ
MDYEKACIEKDAVIFRLTEKIDTMRHELNYLRHVKLRVAKVLKAHPNGDLEVLQLKQLHSTEDGYMVIVN